MRGYGPTGGPDGGIRAAIRAELQRQGRTQAWLAEQLNVSQKHVSMSLRGSNGMALSMIDRIAEVLGASWTLHHDNPYGSWPQPQEEEKPDRMAEILHAPWTPWPLPLAPHVPLEEEPEEEPDE